MNEAKINELDHVCALDIESSGLDEQSDQILEVAAIFGSIKDGQFVSSGKHLSRVLPLITDIETWHEKVLEMHTKNGLLAEAIKVKRDRAEGRHNYVRNAFEQVDSDLVQVAPAKPFKARWTLLGNSVHFDLRFVRRVFPGFAKLLSYRVIDVSSTRLFCEGLGMVTEPAEVPHRAMPDVQSSIALYGKQADWIKNTFGAAQIVAACAAASLPYDDGLRLGSTAVGHGAG